MSKMDSYFPALNLKAKLIVLMVGLLALTLGAEVWVSLGTQAAIVADTQEKVKDLARVIQIGVQELTVGAQHRSRAACTTTSTICTRRALRCRSRRART